MATRSTTSTKKYDESSIKSYQGLAGIRKKPTMYIGETDGHGIFTCGREGADNCADEFMAGRNNYCHWILDGSAQWIIDNGEGMPVGNITIEANEQKLKMSAMRAIVSMTHTGGKFDGEDGAYGDGSRGTHGIGVKATNALAKRFDVWTRRNGKVHHIAYEKGALVQDVEVVKGFPKLPNGHKTDSDTGTIVFFEPDMTVFNKGSKVDPASMHKWAEMAANLNGGLTVDVSVDKDDTVRYYNEKGAEGFLERLIEQNMCSALGDVFIYNSKLLTVALAITDFDGIGLEGYTNGLHNPDGGVHVQNALKAIAECGAKFKKAKQEFKAIDLHDGIVGIINVKIAAPTFNNQTKDKLLDNRVPEPVYKELLEAFDAFLAKNKAMATRWCERAAQVRELKDEFTASKGAMKELKGRRTSLPTKLKQAKCTPGERELFLMEGDSAGGTALNARDRSYQEVLPLRGKIANVYKLGKGKRIWDSEQIMDILKAIGFNPEAENPVAELRVGKIILLGDADVDGWHVNLLNLTLLSKVCPQAFEQGMVYIAKGSEYVIETDEQNYYADSPDQMRKIAPANLMKRLMHLKGWGEVSAKGLSDMAFDPETRTLTKLTLTKTCINRLHQMMGKDVGPRRELLGL